MDPVDPTPPDPDLAERAETYLRLRAEKELRRALASPPLPRVHQTAPPRPLRVATATLVTAAGLAALAARPLAPLARRVMQTRERVQGRALPPPRPVAQLAFGAASRAAEAVSAAVARFGLPVWLRAARHDFSAPAFDGLSGFSTLGAQFAAADLIDGPTAAAITEGLEFALVARSRLRGSAPGFALQRRIRAHRPAAAPPSGSFRAIGLDQAVVIPGDDQPTVVRLLGVVLAPDRAELPISVRPPVTRGRTNRRGLHPFGLLERVTATDDSGIAYTAHFSGGRSDERIDGSLSFGAPIPARACWLDLTIGDAEPVRISLTAAPSAEPELDMTGASPVQRLIDSVSESVLRYQVRGLAGAPADDVPAVIGALREIGAVEPKCAALRRLTALTRRLGTRPPELADVIPSELPVQWASVLGNRDRADGPTGFSPLAVVFPELDGTRCALAGLRSEPKLATMYLFAWGWPEMNWLGGFPEPRDSPFSIWVRDGADRWHIAVENGGGFGGGHAVLELELRPPIHPAANSLAITLAGRSGRATTTVPLSWRDES